MTVVNVSLKHDQSDGSKVAARGSLSWVASKARNAGADVILPRSFNVSLHAGQAAPNPDATPEDGSWWWDVTENVENGRPTQHLGVPADGPVDYDDLPVVVPVAASNVAAASVAALAAVATDVTTAQTTAETAQSTADDAVAGLGGKVNSSTYTAGLAAKADVTSVYTKTAADAATNEAIGDALDTYTTGASLGSAERLTSVTATAVSLAAAVDVTGLTVGPIVGTGRPAELELILPSLVHSVAGTQVSVVLIANGNFNLPQSQYGILDTGSVTTAGQGGGGIVKRQVTLASGVSYTWTVRLFAYNVAGTITASAASPYQAIQLNVTAR